MFAKAKPGEPVSETLEVYSSNGEFTIERTTGKVLKWAPHNPEDEDGKAMGNYVRFDLDEFEKYWDESRNSYTSIDILDLGYWIKDGTYEPPVEDWRQECRGYIHLDNPKHPHLARLDSLRSDQDFELLKETLGLEPGTYTYEGNSMIASYESGVKEGVFIHDRYDTQLVLPGYTMVKPIDD